LDNTVVDNIDARCNHEEHTLHTLTFSSLMSSL